MQKKNNKETMKRVLKYIRKLDMETDDGIFEGKVQLYVHDVEDVKAICNNLRKIPNIKSVTRVEN